MRRLRRALADDDGSTLPLALGYVVLALAVIAVCVDATSLYITQKRLDAVADAAALAGADGFDIRMVGDSPRAVLRSDRVHEQAASLVADSPAGARLLSASTADGTSARVMVGATWSPPILSVFVPDGVALSATATARTALR